MKNLNKKELVKKLIEKFEHTKSNNCKTKGRLVKEILRLVDGIKIIIDYPSLSQQKYGIFSTEEHLMLNPHRNTPRITIRDCIIILEESVSLHEQFGIVANCEEVVPNSPPRKEWRLIGTQSVMLIKKLEISPEKDFLDVIMTIRL